MADRVSYAHATTCSQYRTKEKGLPWFAHDSRKSTAAPILTLLGLPRSQLGFLTEGLKRLGGDKKGIGCAFLKLLPN
jgi:hypothetical protein